MEQWSKTDYFLSSDAWNSRYIMPTSPFEENQFVWMEELPCTYAKQYLRETGAALSRWLVLCSCKPLKSSELAMSWWSGQDSWKVLASCRAQPFCRGISWGFPIYTEWAVNSSCPRNPVNWDPARLPCTRSNFSTFLSSSTLFPLVRSEEPPIKIRCPSKAAFHYTQGAGPRTEDYQPLLVANLVQIWPSWILIVISLPQKCCR